MPACRRRDITTYAPAEVRRALRSGELVAARRGVLIGRDRIAVAATPGEAHELNVSIAIAANRGAPVSAALGSAGVLHDLARLGRTPQRVRLYKERGGHWRDGDVAVLVCRLPSDHLTVVRGLSTTTLARTAVDLARWVSPRSGLVVMDSARRLGATSADLQAVIDDCRQWPGIKRAREIVDRADGRAESPLESVSRFSFAEARLPEPELQARIDLADGSTAVVDFLWKEYGVIGEADGLLKYDDDPSALRREKLRQEALEALGYVVIRWTWQDIWQRPEWVIARLRYAMATSNRRLA
jgi:hypothetical protein